MKLSAVILAAGSGSRMGHRPKGLLKLNGQTLVERLILSLLSVGIKDIVVVLGHYAEDFKQALSTQPVRLALNPDPERGQVSSQRMGLEHTTKEAEGILMALADQPLIDAADLDELISAFALKDPRAMAVHPRVGGVPGNPVILTQAARQAILESDQEVGPRQWRQSNPNCVLSFDSSNLHFITDVDTPEDLKRLQKEHGLCLM
jgi:CTP:molybdopterin cytidylyltransferase MocA